MRHTNPNMCQPVLDGIAAGELAVDDPQGAVTAAAMQASLEDLQGALVPPGDRPFVVGAFLKAKALAYAQGWVAAYRAGTEFDHICECGGTIYATGNQCRETGIHEARCTGCNFHDY